MGVIGAAVGALFVLLVLCALVSPRYALLLVLVMFPLKQLMQASFGYFQAASWQINVAIALSAGAAIATSMVRGRPVLRGYWQPVTACIALFYVEVLLGLLYTPAVSRPAAIFFLTELWPYAILLFIVMPLLLVRLDDFRTIMPAVMLFGTVIIALVLVHPEGKLISGRFVLVVGPPSRGQLTTGNPLATAELGGMLLMAGVLYRATRGQGLITLLRIAAVAAGLAMAVRSGSRGQFLLATGCAALFIPISYKVRNIGGFIAGTVGVGVVLVLALAAKEFLATGEAGRRWDPSVLMEGLFARIEAGNAIFSAFISSPLNYLTGMGTSAYNAFSGDARYYSYPHNVAIEAVTEYGLIGVTILGGAVFATFTSARRLIRACGDDAPLRGAAAILCAITLYSMLLGLKQGSLISLPTFFGWMIMLAKVSRAESEFAAEAPLHTPEEYEQTQPDYIDPVEAAGYGAQSA